jgi:hypothetical protein
MSRFKTSCLSPHQTLTNHPQTQDSLQIKNCAGVIRQSPLRRTGDQPPPSFHLRERSLRRRVGDPESEPATAWSTVSSRVRLGADEARQCGYPGRRRDVFGRRWGGEESSVQQVLVEGSLTSIFIYFLIDDPFMFVSRFEFRKLCQSRRERNHTPLCSELSILGKSATH